MDGLYVTSGSSELVTGNLTIYWYGNTLVMESSIALVNTEYVQIRN